MTTANYTTRQAESLHLAQKYAQALIALQKAIQANSRELYTIDIPVQPPSDGGQTTPPSAPDQSFLDEAAQQYDIPLAKPVTVTNLSLLTENNAWLVTSGENSAQLYLVLRQANQFSLRTFTANCARIFAHCGEAYFQLGRTIPQQFNYQLEAIQDFEKYATVALANLDLATKLKPNYAWAYAKMGEIYRVKGNRYGSLKDRQDDYEAAITKFYLATQLDQTYAWAEAHLGATICNALRSEHYDQALAHLQKAIDLMEGQYAWATAYQGAIYLRQAVESPTINADLLEKAQMSLFAATVMDNQTLEGAVQPGLRHANIYLAFAYMLLKQQHYTQARYYCIQALQKAKRGEPDYVRALYYMAVYFYESHSQESMQAPAQHLPHPHDPSWADFQSFADAHQALTSIAKQLLKDVMVEGLGHLCDAEKDKLNHFPEDEKAAVEEVCTMLLVTDVMADDLEGTTTRIKEHLPRILEILATLAPSTMPCNQICEWLSTPENRKYVHRLVDNIIWQEKLPIEAFETLMAPTERSDKVYV